MTHNPTHRTLRGSAAWRALLVGAVGALLFALGVASPASAAEIPRAITSVTVTDPGPYDSGDLVTVDCSWAVPDHSEPGDFFTLRLPQELKWDLSSPTQFSLWDPTGTSVVAEATVNSAGLVTFVLTDYVRSHPLNVQGGCSFSTRLDYSNATTTPETLELHVDGFIVPLEFVPVERPCAGDCSAVWDARPASKALWWVGDGTGSRLGTRIDTPANPFAGSVTITDTPGPGLALDCSQIEVEMGDALDQNGNIAAPIPVPPSSLSCEEAGLVATWNHVPAGQYLSLTVYVTTTDASRAEYTNRGSVAFAGSTPTEVSAVVQRQTAGGTGQGEGAQGGVSVTKELSGAGAEAVPRDHAFTVEYSYEVDGGPVTGELTVLAGATAVLERIPVGTVVTLAEAAPERVSGLEWGEPVFTGAGVTHTPRGAVVTISGGTDVAVVLTNPVYRVGEDPAPPAQVRPKPSEPRAPEPPVAGAKKLPVTGGPGVGLPVGVAGVLLIVGCAVVVIRMPRRARSSSRARH